MALLKLVAVHNDCLIKGLSLLQERPLSLVLCSCWLQLALPPPLMEHQDKGCCTSTGSRIPIQRRRQSPPCRTLMKKQVGFVPWLCCCAGKASCKIVPCPALPCPALPCPALPCPALPLLMLGNNNCGGDWHYSFCSCCELCLASLPCPWATP